MPIKLRQVLNRSSGLVVITLCSSCVFLPVMAKTPAKTQQKARSKRQNKIFTVSKKPPPGFKVMAQRQTILVDVHYGDQFLGVFKAIVTPNYLHFATPALMVDKIPGIKNKEAVIAALDKNLDPHSSLVCTEYNHETCNMLEPKIAGIIYNPENFQVHVYINKSHLASVPEIDRYLPNSTAGFSYINQMYLVTSNSTGTPVQHNFNLTSNNSLAYKNTHLNVSASYADDLAGNEGVTLNHANLSFVHKRWVFDAGMTETLGNSFFANQTIVGVQAKTILDTMPQADDGLGIPLVVFLNFPSQVAIYKDGKLIHTGQYPAGNNDIDTSEFPEGAYPITIKITNVQGQTKTEQRYYVKTNDLAPIGIPQYYFSLGYLIGYNGFNGGAENKLLNIPVYQAGASVRVADSWDIDLSALGNDKAAYGSAGITYVNHFLEFQPAVLVGTDESVGVSGTMTLHAGRLDLSSNVTRIWHGTKHVVLQGIIDTNNNYFRFLNLNTLIIGSYANFKIGKSSNLSFDATLSDTDFSKTTYAYGPTFTTELFHFPHSNVNFSINGNKTQSGYNVLATLSIDFAKGKWNGGAAAGYNYDKSTGNTNQVHNTGITSHANLAYNHMDSTEYGYKLGVNANTTPASSSVGGTGVYENNRMRVNAYSTYNKPFNLNGFVQYGGAINTRFVWMPQAWTIGSGDSSPNTGVVVDVNAPYSKHETFDIYANNSLVKHIHGDQDVFIKLKPYENYQISVVNTSKRLFSIKDVIQDITLYPGNVQFVQWQASQKYVIAGRVVDQSDQPIRDAAIHGGLGYNTTDDQGYFQADVSSVDHTMDVVFHQYACKITLPKVDVNKDFTYVGDLYCEPSWNSVIIWRAGPESKPVTHVIKEKSKKK